ncbi:hypothetical protein C8R43DRAFT_1131704 [Mycena crocata]|nr:hypothetical protein C8R43DRAFT_1131704 [Mycena crocata]
MALSVPSLDEHAPPILPNLVNAPYEDVQYFSHMQTNFPPRAISGFSDDPEETVRHAVARQWRNYTQKHPLEVNPTFAAAPQSDYGGSVTLPSGQVLHRSTGLNVLRVFRNPETGVPFSIACHEFTYHLEAEQDPTKPWALEVILPSKDRETGFPNHTTNYIPPMVPIDQRLAPERYHPGPDDVRIPIRSVSDAARLDELTDVPEHRGSRGLSSEALAQLAADIQSRAAPSLTFGGIDGHAGYFSYAVPDFSETDSVPDLVDAPYGPLTFHYDNGSSYDPELIPEVCGTCMGPKHDNRGCPYEGRPQRPGAEQARVTYNAFFPNNRIPTPFTTIPEDRRIEQEAAERARQDTDEIRDTLELVLVPLMDEIMGLPTTGTEVYGELASQARSVQIAFGGFADRMEELHAREERLAAETITRVSREVLIDQDDEQELAPTYASRVATPALSGRRGPLVTRDVWSSSSAPSTADSSFDSSQFSPPPTGILSAVDERGSFSPTTEWALESSQPTEPPRSSTIPSPFPSISDGHDDDSERSIPLADIIPLSRVSGPLFFASGSPAYQHLPEGPDYYNTEKYARQRRELDGWLQFRNTHLDDHSRQEDEVASYPLQHVLNTIHGELREFIDYPTMAGANFCGLQTLSPLSMGDPHASSVTADLISDFPDPTQSPTSLDFSLPSNESHERSTANTPSSDPVLESPNEATSSGSKRKDHADKVDSSSGERPCKRLPTHILEPKTIKLFAGSRLGLLEGGRIIESIVWHRYGVSTEFFPDGFITHPLLDDLEAAKLHTLWDVLRFQGRHQLAELLFDLLTIRLRDEYVLNARGLELAYPETQNQYHNLLGVPAYQHSYGPAEFDVDSDSEASGFEGMDLGYPEDEYEGSISVDGYPDSVYDRDLRDDSISVEDTSEIMFAQPPYYDDISYDGSSLSEDASDFMDAASNTNNSSPEIFHVDASTQGTGLYLHDITDGDSHDGDDDDGHIAASQPSFDWSVPVNSVRRALTNPSQISTT